MSSPADQLASVQTLPAKNTRSISADNFESRVAASNDEISRIVTQAEADAELLNSRSDLLADQSNKAANNANTLTAERNISATRSSIFADPAANAAESANANTLQAQAQALNAAQNSIYAGNPDIASRESGAIPLPDADKVSAIQELALSGQAVPADSQAMEVAAADPAANADVATGTVDQKTARLDVTPTTRSLDAVPDYETALSAVEAQPDVPKKKERMTLAEFFSKKRETAKSGEFDKNRFAKNKRITTSKIPNMRTAALGDDQLPGVNANAMFSLKQMSGDEYEDDEPAGLMKVASLSGMTRVAPNGLRTQTEHVDVSCLRPQLVRMIKQVERHYGKPAIVTSGYRDPYRNRRAGGVRHSLHTLCAAADIQVEGVSKWQLADYLRSIPGRGGVGTYCHTQSVHIDIGSERDWNWRCRRRARR